MKKHNIKKCSSRKLKRIVYVGLTKRNEKRYFQFTDSIVVNKNENQYMGYFCDENNKNQFPVIFRSKNIDYAVKVAKNTYKRKRDDIK